MSKSQATHSLPPDETSDSQGSLQGTNPQSSLSQNPVQRSGLSRRNFLRAAFAGGATLVVAACGGNDPPTPASSSLATPAGPQSLLPTPAGSQVYLPIVQKDGVAEVGMASVDTPGPVATATHEPSTATPEPPTPTPTPPPTPFPPGPPSKIGLFVARNHPQIFDLLATQAVTVVKTLELDRNFLAQIKQTSPATLIVGRIDLPQLDLGALGDPLATARSFVDALLPIADDPDRRRYMDAWEAYNEPVPGNPDEMKRLAELEAERTRLLAERGLRSVVGNFGTGQPPLEWWQHFFPALQAAKQYNGWLGLHEYSAPTIYYHTTRDNQQRYPGVSPEDSGWLTLRYRKVYNDVLLPAGLGLPLVMTELGVDGLVQDRPGPPDALGWMDFQQYWAENGYGLWGPGAYVEQLVWYDEAMRQNDYVLGGCIYVMAASDGWQSYDILGPAAAVLQQYLGVHTPV